MKSNLLKLLSAFGAGLLTNAAFEPGGVFPLVFVTLAVLFWIWSESSARICAWSGFVFALGFYGFGIHWIYNSLHDFGGAPPGLAGFMVFALACFLSLLVAAGGFLQARLRISGTLRCLAVIPAVWVAVEWIRSWILTGFPWLYVGYSQTDSWLAGWAPILGVLGVSFMVCLIAGFLVHSYRTGFRIDVMVLTLAVALAGLWGRTIDWTSETHPPINVAIVQADVDILDKWNFNNARSHLDFFVAQTAALVNQDLVLWPEIAIVQTDRRLDKLKLWRLLESLAPDVLVGVVEEQQIDDRTVHYNSAFGISDDVHKYRKRHLVPFGEFIPFRSLLGWLNNYIEIPESDFTSYDGIQPPLVLAGQPAAISICYEDAFPLEFFQVLPEATYLVNLSEDAWFGDRLAPFQRLQMSRMRAIEAARPLLRAANKGISAAVDHKGNVVAQLMQDEGKVLKTQITPKSGSTPYVRFGNVPVLLLCVISFALALVRRRPAREAG
ncbi:MAG: apolipoprotein N-acyltransferase [Acidiferrobacterales bacterium]|nr:apolipoprotein N-acyltransferase [Acidiferrobacterales bacterium]